MFQIADIYRLLEDSGASVDGLKHALSISQTDPSLLQELGNLHDNVGDKSAAFQTLPPVTKRMRIRVGRSCRTSVVNIQKLLSHSSS